MRLPHLPNLRDVGGLPTEDGRVTAAGRVFRSDAPIALDADEVELLVGRCGIRTVVDLRVADDVAVGPDYPLSAAGVRRVELPISIVAGATRPPAGQRVDLLDAYRTYLRSDTQAVVAALGELAAAREPVLVHCSAGKDRTGTVIALALRLVGVTLPAVAADYARTADNVDALLAEWRRRNPALADALPLLPDGLFAAEPETITRLFAWIDATYGGVHAWARGAGLTDAQVASLRAWLVPQ